MSLSQTAAIDLVEESQEQINNLLGLINENRVPEAIQILKEWRDYINVPLEYEMYEPDQYIQFVESATKKYNRSISTIERWLNGMAPETDMTLLDYLQSMTETNAQFLRNLGVLTPEEIAKVQSEEAEFQSLMGQAYAEDLARQNAEEYVEEDVESIEGSEYSESEGESDPENSEFNESEEEFQNTLE